MPSLKKLPRASDTDATTTTITAAADTDSAQSILSKKRKKEKAEETKKKRKSSEKKEKKERKSKKRRLDEEEEDDDDAEDEGTGTGTSALDAAETTRTKSQKTKKSKRVSFAPDVADGIDADNENEDDGDSDVNVPDHGTNGSGRERETDAMDETPGDNATLDDAMAKKKKKKKKKEKQKERSTTTTAESTTTPSTPSEHEPPILSYLSQYHQNRSAWKFNKNRETHLFKHLWSLDHVPAKYNAALLAYLKGLKSEGARQRLSQAAEEYIKADVEGKIMADPGADNKEAEGTDKPAITDSKTAAGMDPADKEAYEKAIQSFRSDLVADDMAREVDPEKDDDAAQSLNADLFKRLDKRRRADLVYFAVHGRTFDIFKQMPKNSAAIRTLKVAHQSQTDGANGQPAKKKKRKNRTAVIEISSSESDSDSDSDS